MNDGVFMVGVWLPTPADYLELLTTRLGAFLGISSERPSTSSLADIRNTLIAYARHGQGEHVGRFGHGSDIDFARDRMRQQAARVKQGGA